MLAEGKHVNHGGASEFDRHVTSLQERVLKPQEREDGSKGMHDLGIIVTVKAGDSLVRRIPVKAGGNGYTVTADILFSKAPKDIPFNIGEGAQISPEDENLLIATYAGVPLKLSHGFSVSEILVLENVDLHTGNIEYDGTVMVNGNVEGGMLVKATNDVIIQGSVESAIIESGGNVEIQQGVIGHEIEDEDVIEKEHFSCQIIAHDNISAKYAQSAFLRAGKDISIASQLLRCDVKAEEGVYVGKEGQKRSKLIGGITRAGTTVAAGEIGSLPHAITTINFPHRLIDLDGQRKSIKADEMIDGFK